MKDLFSEQAKDYAKYRPRYPDDLFRYLSKSSLGHGTVWDVGTGNGQVAQGLTPFFDRIIATDISEKQLSEAEEHSQIFYATAPAHKVNIASETVDLVVAAQAMHWFDHQGFFAEVARVSTAGAKLAVVSYALCNITPEIDVLVNHFYSMDLGRFWDPERKMVENAYAEVRFPFKEIEAPSFQMTYDWSAKDFIGYLGTWSAVKKAEKSQPSILSEFAVKLFKIWPEEEKRKIVFPLSVRVFII